MLAYVWFGKFSVAAKIHRLLVLVLGKDRHILKAPNWSDFFDGSSYILNCFTAYVRFEHMVYNS